MYAVKHVNLIDTQTPPKKNANHARSTELVEVRGSSRGDRNSFVHRVEKGRSQDKCLWLLCLVVVAGNRTTS